MKNRNAASWNPELFCLLMALLPPLAMFALYHFEKMFLTGRLLALAGWVLPPVAAASLLVARALSWRFEGNARLATTSVVLVLLGLSWTALATNFHVDPALRGKFWYHDRGLEARVTRKIPMEELIARVERIMQGATCAELEKGRQDPSPGQGRAVDEMNDLVRTLKAHRFGVLASEDGRPAGLILHFGGGHFHYGLTITSSAYDGSHDPYGDLPRWNDRVWPYWD